VRVRHVNKPEMEGGWNIVAKKRSRGLFCSVKELNGVVTSSCKSFQRFVAACSYTRRLQKEGRAIYTHSVLETDLYYTVQTFSQRCTAFTKDRKVKGESQILKDSHDNHLWLATWALYYFLSLALGAWVRIPIRANPLLLCFFFCVFLWTQTPSYRTILFLSSPTKSLLIEIWNPESGKP